VLAGKWAEKSEYAHAMSAQAEKQAWTCADQWFCFLGSLSCNFNKISTPSSWAEIHHVIRL